MTNNLKNKFHVILSLLIIAITFSACSNIDVQILNNKAAELMNKGDIDGAISRLESIQDLNPNFPQTNYNLGIAYKEKKDYNKALNYLEKAIKLNPKMYQAHIALSVIAEEMATQILNKEIDKLQKQNPNKTINYLDLNLNEEPRQRIIRYFTIAKSGLEDFIKYSPATKDNQEYNQKIKEFDQYISKFSPKKSMDPQKTSNQNTNEDKILLNNNPQKTIERQDSQTTSR